MPQLKEKKLVNPSSKFMANLEKHWASAQINMPEAASKARVRPMSDRESSILGNPTGMAYPNNTISINPSNPDIRDTLVHELTHVNQKPRGLVEFMKDRFTPHHKRRIEVEATNAEATYPWREKGRDTWLPPEKKRKK